MKVVIVGAGIHGLCLAWALVRNGHHVTVLERGSIPNPLNASYDQHRLIHDFNRRSPGDPTITEAFAAWQALSQDIGPLYVETGAVCGFADAGSATRTLDELRHAGVVARLLSSRELLEVLPGLHLDPEHCAIATERGGVLLADQVAILLTDWLRRHGVVLRPSTAVVSLDHGRPAAVLGDGKIVSADIVIACVGAATSDLAPMLAVGARRQILAYLEPPRHLERAWRSAPIFVNFGGADDLWGAPPAAGTHLKLAAGRLARPSSPDHPDDRSVTTTETQMLLTCIRKHLPQFASYRVLRMTACTYSTASRQSVLQCPLDDHHSVWAVAGYDGSDYKLAPALAWKLAARLAR